MPNAVKVLGVGALCALAVLRLGAALDANEQFDYLDFGVFYRAAGCVLSGCDPYAIPADGAPPNLAPPHVLLFFLIGRAFSIHSAYSLALVVYAVSLAWCAKIISREVCGRRYPWCVVYLSAIAGSSGLMVSTVTSGNYYPVLAIPITLSWIAWRRQRFVLAGVWIGLAASCKVLLFLPLVWFVVKRQYLAALATIAMAALIFVSGIAILGSDVYLGWLSLLARAPMTGQFHDASILQTAIRVLTQTMQYEPLLEAPMVVRPIWAAMAGVVVSITVSLRRDPDRTFLALLATAILVAPIGWVFGFWWLVGPAVAVWKDAAPLARVALGGTAAGVWMPDTLPLLGQPSGWLSPTLGSLNMWILFGILFVAWSPGRAYREQRCAKW